VKSEPALLVDSMPSREFPVPPDLSELLKFFESSEGKARVTRQNGATRVVQRSPQHSSRPAFSKRLSRGSLHTSFSKVWKEPDTTKPIVSGGHRLSRSSLKNGDNKSVGVEKVPVAPHSWNGSTQLPPAPANILRHQLLCRTYQPPAPVYVAPSEAGELLDRLAKGTISSRSKLKSQGDSNRGGAYCSAGGDERTSNGVRSASLADTRGRDAIQTLLFYRKEVEKRRRLDTSDGD
jgi:hypothetical protein